MAPMAGVADRAMRELCLDYGAAAVTSEMVSAKGFSMGDKKSAELLTLSERERPAAIQLFGDDPRILEKAAKMAMEYGPDFIDINMGCPVPKVALRAQAGSALLKNPQKIYIYLVNEHQINNLNISLLKLAESPHYPPRYLTYFLFRHPVPDNPVPIRRLP